MNARCYDAGEFPAYWRGGVLRRDWRMSHDCAIDETDCGELGKDVGDCFGGVRGDGVEVDVEEVFGRG